MHLLRVYSRKVYCKMPHYSLVSALINSSFCKFFCVCEACVCVYTCMCMCVCKCRHIYAGQSTALQVIPVLRCYLRHSLTKLFSLGLELTLYSQQILVLSSTFDVADIKDLCHQVRLLILYLYFIFYLSLRCGLCSDMVAAISKSRKL